MFALVVVVLILIYVVAKSFFVITLFSFVTTLLVFYSYNNGYDGLAGILNIKPNIYNLGDYGSDACGPNAYSLSV